MTKHDASCESELTSHGYTLCRCEDRAALALRPYGVRNVVGDVWLDEHGSWHGREQALRFGFVTTALAYGVSAGLDPEQFVVEVM